MQDNARPLRFHWSVPASGARDRLRGSKDRSTAEPLGDLEGQLELCRIADSGGIDQLLLPIGYHRADPIALATWLGGRTERVSFMLASRSGIISPTYYVQQINTVSALIGGRVSVNVVAGHNAREMRFFGDFLSHDERFQRSDEFWTICHALWRSEGPVSFEGSFLRVEEATINTPFVAAGRTRPELWFSGSSELAAELAVRHGDCLLLLADAPERLAPRIRPVLGHGVEVGLLMTLIARRSHDEAVRAAHALVEAAGDSARGVHRRFRQQADSVGFASTYALGDGDSSWLTPYLWSGAVPYMGPPSIALVGSAEEVTEALFEYRRAGVTQFMFQGRPDIESVSFLGREILPRVREREQAAAAFQTGG